MSVDAVIAALDLPAGSRVDQRVPKKLLLEHGAPTPADKRQIQDGIGEITWVAALKPTSIGVPTFTDDVREYLEVAVLTVELRPAANASRLVELIHRAVPYPLLLTAAQNSGVSVSVAHKRRSQGETGKVVVEEVRRTADFRPDARQGCETAFLASLALAGLPRRDLFTLYQGWLDRIAALEAARIAGTFNLPASADRTAAVLAALDCRARLQRDIAGLRATAAKEKPVNRRVELNLELKRLETELAATMQTF